jgi:cytochrome c553
MNRAITLAAITVALGLAGSPPDAAALDAEEKAAVCTGCHGPSGHSAVPDNPILAAQHQDYLLAALKAYISGERDNGIMKTMAGRLSEEDLADITAYFSAQPPHQSKAVATGDAASGKAKAAPCAACHGADGNSVNPMFPSLTGQHAVYLSKAVRAYRSGARSSNMMPLAMIESLSDADIDDIAAYFSAQSAQPSSSDTQKDKQ